MNQLLHDDAAWAALFDSPVPAPRNSASGIEVTSRNFDAVFSRWRESVGADASHESQALFLSELASPPRDGFWSAYLAPSPDEHARIIARKDRLAALCARQVEGAYFTPLRHARRAHEYLSRAMGDDLYQAHWWDMACGTANLTRPCPEAMGERLFLSTLHAADIAASQSLGQHAAATRFVYDFLGGTDDELPLPLQEALRGGGKWVFLLNPPYAHEASLRGGRKTGASDTRVGAQMREKNMGIAVANASAQFLYRISLLARDYPLDLTVGLFSQPTFLTGDGYAKIRTLWRSTFAYQSGYCFSSEEFDGTAARWPVLFSVWRTHGECAEDQADAEGITCDVWSGERRTGAKRFESPRRPLSHWVPRSARTVLRPPMTSALSTFDSEPTGNPICDKWAEGSIGFLVYAANDVAHNKASCLLSGPYKGGQGWSILPGNLTESLACGAVRAMVRGNWQNDKDQYRVPVESEGLKQFLADAAAWMMLSLFNHTSSRAGVVYRGIRYDVPNLLCFLNTEDVSPDHADSLIVRPGALWRRETRFSPDVESLWNSASALIRAAYPFRQFADPLFQLDRPDAGWYQWRKGIIENASAEAWGGEIASLWEAFRAQHRSLSERLIPLIYAHGFLPAPPL